MQSKAATVAEYLASLDAERKGPVTKLHRTIKRNLPKGFVDTIAYGMISYVVPHVLYPAGYHVDPKRPLPFISLASQKNYIALYHMGLYEGALLAWFRAGWKKACDAKLDIGKSCVRLKKIDTIPYDLIGELATKVTPAEWIAHYEKSVKR
jgi:hypothetical protein